MTREEIINEIKSILEELDYPDAVSYLTQNDRGWLEENIRVLEQESCEDAVRRQAVLDLCDSKDPDYKVIHFKEDVECLPPVTPQPCDNVISRQAVLDIVDSYSESQSNVEDVTQDIISDIVALSPVNPQSKMGHWINLEKKYKGQKLPFWGRYECSKCGGYGEGTFKYCPNCGSYNGSD